MTTENTWTTPELKKGAIAAETALGGIDFIDGAFFS
jgi:hypothetical protein